MIKDRECEVQVLDPNTTKGMAYCGMFVVLITIGTYIKIPIPVLPFTLQFLFTMLAGTLLGSRLGARSVAIYTILGLIGVPVFSEGGGLFYIMKPSFGYIIGFIVSTYLIGIISEKWRMQGIVKYLVANFVGLVVVYSIGMIYYYIICNYIIDNPIGVASLFLYCFVLAVPGDVVLCILAAIITPRVKAILSM